MRALLRQDGLVDYEPCFINGEQSTQFFAVLRDELAWHEEFLRIASKLIKVPRLVCWYGDPGAVYRYSGVDHDPRPWTATLLLLRDRVEHVTGQKFNSVLGNYYRNGQDSLGWHADKEKELGEAPVIASLSFGAERLFRLRHNKTREAVDVLLTNGSLLVMSGKLQHSWRHCVPKVRNLAVPRINLTFRYVIPDFNVD